MKPVVGVRRADTRDRIARVDAVKKLRALRRRMNLRTTQAEIRRAIARGQV